MSSPAITPAGGLYFGSGDKTIYALNVTLNGAVIWKKPTGGAVWSSPIVDAMGRLYVGSDDKHVYGLLASNGSELWKYRTGVYALSGHGTIRLRLLPWN